MQPGKKGNIGHLIDFVQVLFIDIYGAFFVLLKGHVSECIISYNSAVDVTFHQSVCCLLF